MRSHKRVQPSEQSSNPCRITTGSPSPAPAQPWLVNHHLVRRPDKRPSTWRPSVREQAVTLPRCRTPEPDPNAGPDPTDGTRPPLSSGAKPGPPSREPNAGKTTLAPPHLGCSASPNARGALGARARPLGIGIPAAGHSQPPSDPFQAEPRACAEHTPTNRLPARQAEFDCCSPIAAHSTKKANHG